MLVANLTAATRGQPGTARYDGYTSCPLVTSRNRMLLAEFDYDLKPGPSIPLIDTMSPATTCGCSSATDCPPCTGTHAPRPRLAGPQLTRPGPPPLATTGSPARAQARIPPPRLDTSRPSRASMAAARADRAPDRHTVTTARRGGTSAARRDSWPSGICRARGA